MGETSNGQYQGEAGPQRREAREVRGMRLTKEVLVVLIVLFALAAGICGGLFFDLDIAALKGAAVACGLLALAGVIAFADGVMSGWLE